LLTISADDYLRQYPAEGTFLKFPVSSKIFSGPNLYIYNIHILKDILLAGIHGIPISKTGYVIGDRFINLDVQKLLMQLSQIPEEDLESAFIFKEKCLPLYSDWAGGFWHWMMENLPIVMLTEDSGYDGYYLIHPASFARESIELLGVPSERILEYRGGHLFVETLYLPQRFAGGDIEPDILLSLRQKLLDTIEPSLKGGPDQRIYISRNKLNTRRRIVVNEDELSEVIAPYGFKTVYMEQISLKEQIALMSRANVLITPHGAGMVHTLFMPPQSLVIELFAPTYINPTMLSAIKLLKHRYFIIPSYLNEPAYKLGGNIEAFLQVIEITLNRELGAVDAGKD
jgi:hypothetical protein